MDVNARTDGVLTCPAVSTGADAEVSDVLASLRKNAVRRLPVTQDDRPTGIISIDDPFVRADELAPSLAAEGPSSQHNALVPAIA